eukprot:CAMPEP_0115425386 /NCGR_PEP_ID=MMETSP0271-20121206/28348_1 /TAXON_ID=71861 /ORGANISM="Scrippsiella trochoidea, Strain CCMP3099" /LENGTH=107 /DNA_ID=CAMNT_0002850273 /DNA_START=63 /DNA_END=382 /DNA_ORIENTATION=-
MASNFQRRELERFRGAVTVSEGKASTISAIKPGDATGVGDASLHGFHQHVALVNATERLDAALCANAETSAIEKVGDDHTGPLRICLIERSEAPQIFRPLNEEVVDP